MLQLLVLMVDSAQMLRMDTRVIARRDLSVRTVRKTSTSVFPTLATKDQLASIRCAFFLSLATLYGDHYCCYYTMAIIITMITTRNIVIIIAINIVIIIVIAVNIIIVIAINIVIVIDIDNVIAIIFIVVFVFVVHLILSRLFSTCEMNKKHSQVDESRFF